MKTNKRLIVHAIRPGTFMIEGELTFATIDKNTIELLTFNNDMHALILDLKQVTTTDSAGLALLLEWIKMARIKKIQLFLENIPAQLLAIAKLSGLESMLQMKP